MSRFSKAVAASVAGVVLAAASVAAIAQVSEDGEAPPGSTPPAAPPPGSKAAVQSVGTPVAAAVGSLRGRRTAEDALPADVAKYIDWAPIEGANGRLSRKALSKGGRTLYLMPGDGVACLVLTGPGPGATGPLCDSPNDLSSGSGGPGVLHNDCEAPTGNEVPTCAGATLFGIVPDRVKEVTVHLSSGRSVSTPVHKNAYLVDVEADPQTVEFEGPTGSVQQLTP
jgi:hypothetical protein